MSSASLFSAKLLNASLFRFEVLGSRAAPTPRSQRATRCMPRSQTRALRSTTTSHADRSGLRMSMRDGVDKHQFAASMSDHQRLLKLGAAGPYIGTTGRPNV